MFGNHLAQVDCGSGGVGDPGQDLEGKQKRLVKLKESFQK